MVDILRISKGLSLTILGKPSRGVRTFSDVKRLVIDLENHVPIALKLVVADQAHVNRGDVLCVAKTDERICFLAPGSGVVHLKENRVEIVLDEKESDRQFSAFQNLDGVSSDTLRQRLLDGGLWSVFRQYPLNRVPDPQANPPAIYVSLDDQEPFHPEPEVYLKGVLPYFSFGLEALRKLIDGPVYVAYSHGNWQMKSLLMRLATHAIEGQYPANDLGVYIYHNKGSAYENTSFGIRGQDVVRIGKFLKDGTYPYEKIAVIAGECMQVPTHCRIREGSVVADVLEDKVNYETSQLLMGGVFRGRYVQNEAGFGYLDDAILAIPRQLETETFAPYRLGKKVSSYTKGFWSGLFKKPTQVSSDKFGVAQHCIGCDICADVCPVDILPQHLLDAVQNGDRDLAKRHGLLDCVSCGLCTFVCPSKIELGKAFDKARELEL